MSWGNQHPVEAAVEWLAPIPLALAVGWASTRLGLPPIHSAGLAVVALLAGIAVFKLGGGTPYLAIHDFQAAPFEWIELDELVLEENDSVLELSDRLEEANADGRVVRLFERQDSSPGELVDRIVDFLAEGRRPAPSERPEAGNNGIPDASAALHDALANIRASLR